MTDIIDLHRMEFLGVDIQVAQPDDSDIPPQPKAHIGLRGDTGDTLIAAVTYPAELLSDTGRYQDEDYSLITLTLRWSSNGYEHDYAHAAINLTSKQAEDLAHALYVAVGNLEETQESLQSTEVMF